MKKQRFFVGLLLLLLLACTPQQPRLEPLAQDAVVVAFGDSLTYGSGAPKADSYPNVLEKLIHRKVVNEGVKGSTTIDGVERLPYALQEYHPALVILCLGGNDVIKHIPTAKTIFNLRRMIQLIRQSGAQVVLLAVPKKSLLLNAPDFYKKIGEKYNIPVDEDLVPDLIGDRKYKSDWVHLNALGYRKMAEGVAKLLKQEGAI